MIVRTYRKATVPADRTECPHCGWQLPEAEGPVVEIDPGSDLLRFSVLDGRLMVTGIDSEAVVEPAVGAAQRVRGHQVQLEPGSLLRIGNHTLQVAEPRSPAPSHQLDRWIAGLQHDAAAMVGVLRDAQGIDSPHAAAVECALDMAVLSITSGAVSGLDDERPHIAPATLVEDLGVRFAGAGGTVWLPKTWTETPAAFVSLGNQVILGVVHTGGPEPVSLAAVGFSQVSAVRCRRFAKTFRAVEWQYVDRPRRHDEPDLSMDRMVATFPEVPGGLDEVWQQRLLAMLAPDEW